jgi:hypothetical protein
MPTGHPGADSAVPLTSQVQGLNLVRLANQLYGASPVFWGRYFSSVSVAGDVEYRHLIEDQLLRN